MAFAEGKPGVVQPLLQYDGDTPRGPDGAWPHRPVGVREGLDGELYISSDASGVIIALGYAPPP